MSAWNEEEDGMGFGGLLPTRAELRAERDEEFRRARENEKLNMAYASGRKDEREEWLPLLDVLREARALIVEAFSHTQLAVDAAEHGTVKRIDAAIAKAEQP